MAAITRAVRAGADNRRARRSTMLDLPPHGWSAPDRAPALRREAARLDRLADHHPQPCRVRRLARDLRIRAAEIELGAEVANSDFDELVEVVATGRRARVREPEAS